MPQKSDRFGAVKLSPGRDAPLLSTPIDAIASPSVSLTLTIVSATSLRPMHKNITSHPMCEVSLLLDDGSGLARRLQDGLGSSGDKLLANHGNSTAPLAGAVCAKTFKTKVVRTSLNPIWNLDVDFGDYNVESVVGVLIVVKHIEKMGMVKKDIGQVLLTMRELLELKALQTREKEYTLEATDEVMMQGAQEGPTNRKFGKVTVRFSSYGVPQQAASTSQAQSNYTRLMSGEPRHSTQSDGSVTHEDDFSARGKQKPAHDVQAEIKKLQSLHQTKPVPGEVWFAVNSKWITDWLLFVSKHKGQPEHHPGPIDNIPLLSDDLPDGRFEIRRDLIIKKNFRMINRPSWEYYQTQYGGGPAIEVVVPQGCANTTAWITSLKLHEVGRVGSGYVGSGSEDLMEEASW
ncbi:hypothetical protein P43SY_000648 [Pythium insidiosum]|uniref:DUSP domain-containing protein n=1 Tax=Pythium insidiosum TaxID=114742 RepID=A0AAD5M637_PYTIN|nr:hypothetical protein P43SY_000648 [Pythium insidiosum]